jgi:hypothetical protein
MSSETQPTAGQGKNQVTDPVHDLRRQARILDFANDWC